MLKKYMIFGSVVLLTAALFALTGCTQATSGESGTVTYAENYLYGTSDETDVKAAITAAKARDRVVVLTDNLRLTGSSSPLAPVADFENLTIRVEGRVEVTDMIINAPFANLVFEPGGRINLNGDSVFIYDGEPDDKNISEGAKVKYVRNPLTGTQGTDQKIAVLDYTIGTNFIDIHPNVTDLYVLNTLTVNAGSTVAPGAGVAGTPRIYALGTVDLAASNTVVFADLDNFVFTTSSVLKSTGTGVILTLTADSSNSATNLPTIEAATPLTIVSTSFGDGTGESSIADVKGPETVTLNAPLSGDLTTIAVSEGGKLRVTATSLAEVVRVTNNAGRIEFDATTVSAGGVTIAQNTGEVIFKNNLTLAASMLKAPVNNGSIIFQGTLTAAANLGSSTTPADNIAGSGKVEIAGATTFTAGPVNIDCAIVFNDAVTVADGILTLGGDVTLANEKAITFTAGGDAVTLKAGKTFFVGTEPVLAAGEAGVVITPVATAALTAGEAFDPDGDEDAVEYKTLTLSAAAAATITSGELRVQGILETAQALTVTGALTLDAGGILLIDGTGTVVLGGTTIATANGQLAAAGGAVTLKPETITGRGSTLQVPEDATGPTITVGGTGQTLTLAGANLDLQYGGSLVLTGNASANKVLLDSGSYPGKLTLSEEDTLYTAGSLSGKKIEAGTNDATLSGTGALYGDSAGELPSAIGQLSGTQAGGLIIIGAAAGNDVTITAGASVDNP